MTRYLVDVSHTVRKSITVWAPSASEAEDQAVRELPKVESLDGWESDQEFSATAWYDDEPKFAGQR